MNGLRRSSLGGRRRWQRGSSLVEGSFILVLFMGLILATMSFARLVYTQNVLTYAAREGTRYAMVRGNDSGHAASASDVETIVRSRVPGLTPRSVVVTTTWTPDNKPGSKVRVRVRYAISERMTLYAPMALTLVSASEATIQQ